MFLNKNLKIQKQKIKNIKQKMMETELLAWTLLLHMFHWKKVAMEKARVAQVLANGKNGSCCFSTVCLSSSDPCGF